MRAVALELQISRLAAVEKCCLDLDLPTLNLMAWPLNQSRNRATLVSNFPRESSQRSRSRQVTSFSGVSLEHSSFKRACFSLQQSEKILWDSSRNISTLSGLCPLYLYQAMINTAPRRRNRKAARFAIYRINQCFCIANVSGSGHQAPAACHGFSPELSRAGVFFGND
jgi:hypothetical protein